MIPQVPLHKTLAASITRAASAQTYTTIRFLADRDRAADAFRAYAYFRWVDDVLDAESISKSEREDFIKRQMSLLESCYSTGAAREVNPKEKMLVDLIQRDANGIQTYVKNMMAVMAFDAERRGRLIAKDELALYTRNLATAVTEAMHYFIGHDDVSPRGEARYFAVTAAHITHMLRDTRDDIKAGYYNIPREALDGASPLDTKSDAYRRWVRERTALARKYFAAGKEALAQVGNTRCRFAGLAYTTRFEKTLDLIERDGYVLRNEYPEHSTLASALGAVAKMASLNASRTSKFSGAAVNHARGGR